MVIEWLVVAVPLDWHDRYLVADAAIWTAFLQTCSGFQSKQVWQNPAAPEELILVIQWETRAEWKAIDPADLAATEARFSDELGRSFPLKLVQEYQIRP
jgi:uncharacterized protein (TIGR03792 family)